VIILSRTAPAILFLLSLFIASNPSRVFAQQGQQEDSDSKGDISTENNPNLGQQKQQILEEQKQTDGSTDKKEKSTSQDKTTNTGRNDARPERPQRFERPMRPERPHR
jgi:hypothetical protein